MPLFLYTVPKPRHLTSTPQGLGHVVKAFGVYFPFCLNFEAHKMLLKNREVVFDANST